MTSRIQLENEIQQAINVNDRSTHPNVIEYAVHYLFQKKSPRAAAQATARKLSGTDNIFLGPGTTTVDPETLERALWEKLTDLVISRIPKNKKGFEHYALDGTVQQFRQEGNKTVRPKLKQLVVQKLGHDPFIE